jgi:FHS family Na+ dependent glucose MFS transporter 1
MTVLFLLGMGEGVVDVGANALVGWVHSENTSPWLNGLHFAFGIGAFLAPVIVSLTMGHPNSLALCYFILAVLILPSAFLLWQLPSPRRLSAKESSRANSLDRRLTFSFVLFLGLYVGAEIGFNGWIFTYGVTLNLTSESSGAYLTALFWGALTAGRLLAIPISSRVRPKTILCADVIGCLASLAVIMIGSNTPAALWVGTLGTGLSMASIFPTTLALAGQRMELTGRITSWFIVGSNAGSIVLPWIMGRFLAIRGPEFMLWILLIDLACAGTVLVGIIPFKRELTLLVATPISEKPTFPSISA